MTTKQPFIYWVEFLDSLNATYFFYSIIVASSAAEAKEWGDLQSLNLVESGEAKAIENTWVEPTVDDILDGKETAVTDWSEWVATVAKNGERYYLGTASNSENESLNAVVKSMSGKSASDVWSDYLSKNRPDFKVETCSFIDVPIVEVGNSIEW